MQFVIIHMPYFHDQTLWLLFSISSHDLLQPLFKGGVH